MDKLKLIAIINEELECVIKEGQDLFKLKTDLNKAFINNPIVKHPLTKHAALQLKQAYRNKTIDVEKVYNLFRGLLALHKNIDNPENLERILKHKSWWAKNGASLKIGQFSSNIVKDPMAQQISMQTGQELAELPDWTGAKVTLKF